MATRTIRLSLSLPERDVTRTVVMSENSNIDMLRIVTCIAFGWEYHRGYVTVDDAVHPPMKADTPLKEILRHETYVSPVAGDGIKVRVEFGEVSDVPADKCLSCHGDYAKLKELTKDAKPNPHYTHMLDQPCAECHKAHKPSVNMCQECHQFDFKVP